MLSMRRLSIKSFEPKDRFPHNTEVTRLFIQVVFDGKGIMNLVN